MTWSIREFWVGSVVPVDGLWGRQPMGGGRMHQLATIAVWRNPVHIRAGQDKEFNSCPQNAAIPSAAWYDSERAFPAGFPRSSRRTGRSAHFAPDHRIRALVREREIQGSGDPSFPTRPAHSGIDLAFPLLEPYFPSAGDRRGGMNPDLEKLLV